MSIIQQLRDKAAVLLTTLIALSLIGFLVQDAFVGRTSGFFSGNTTTVGSINGKEIDAVEFNNKVNLAEQNYRSQGMESNEMMTQNIIESIWNGYVQEELLKSECEKAGLAVTSKELSAVLFSEDAPQEFQQLFTDPKTGQFDIGAARNWFNNLKKSKKSEEIRMVTEQLLNPLQLRMLSDKYNSLFSQGAYVPKWMVEKLNTDNSSIASIRFVGIPYPTVSDSLASLKVTDGEIEKYVSEHKDEFKQEKVRNVSYVVFDASPTAADSNYVLNQLVSLKEGLLNTTDPKGFVTRNNSSNPFFDGYVLKSRLQMSAKDDIISMPVGTVIGPYLDANTYTIARKVDARSLPDSVKCRHILVGTVDPRTGQMRMPDSVARKKADSILTAIKGGSDFGLLAALLSDDEGSKNNKGEYNFSSVDITNLAKEFGDFILYKPTGSREVVKTSFGYHIIEVLNQKDFQEAYKMAYVSKRIASSQETDNAASSSATQFSGNSRDPKSFDANLTTMKLVKRTADNIREMDYSVAGMPSRAMVKWIFENKVGSVSEPFDLKDKYVVVMVTGSLNEGVQPASMARVLVEPILRNRKKAEEIRRKIGSNRDLESVAAANGMQVIAKDSVYFSNPFVPDLGSEPKVIGAAFNKSMVGKVSEPIEGNNGVFLLKVESIGAVSAANADVMMQKRAMEMQLKQYAGFGTMEALRKSAKVKDTRREAGY
jgi:peptidyl-prolyl cis-trans isomerase D